MQQRVHQQGLLLALVSLTSRINWFVKVMATSVSRGVYHHGKRHRFVATAKDDSREAFEAALDELDEKVRVFTAATTSEITRQSYRKKKGH